MLHFILDAPMRISCFVIFVHQLVANLTSDLYAETVRREMHMDHTHGVKYYKPKFYNVDDSGTSHMNVIAADGSAVALTSTINYLWVATVVNAYSDFKQLLCQLI